MCGIVGTFNARQNREEIHQLLTEKIAMLFHRGPDNSDVVSDSGWGIAHARLSIVDYSPAGAQPFIHQGVYLVCNGEIYNHEELRKLVPDFEFKGRSDNEVIIALYLKYGAHCVEFLDGDFAFLIYDSRNGHFMAARDPLGVKPLFFKNSDSGETWFASERHVLNESDGEVYAFEPGSYWTSDKGHIRYYKPRWWNYCGPVPVFHRELDYDELRGLVEAAVTKRLMADVPLGCMLSGGIDSSIVTAVAARNFSGRLKTFTVGFSSESESVDLHYARLVAKHLGTDHHELIVTEEDVFEGARELLHLGVTPGVVLDTIPQYLLYKYAKQFVRVMLLGEGADEIFNGYGSFPGTLPSRAQIQEQACHSVLCLSNSLLLRADHASMKQNIEARVPFLDTELVDYVMTLDPELKTSDEQRPEKYILRKAFEEYLPPEIIWRGKVGGTWGYGNGYKMKCRPIVARAIEEFARHRTTVSNESGQFRSGPHILPMCDIYNQYRGGVVHFPEWFYGKSLTPAVRDIAASEFTLVAPHQNCQLELKAFCREQLGFGEEIVFSEDMKRLLSAHGLSVDLEAAQTTLTLDELIGKMRLVSWRIDVERLQDAWVVKPAVSSPG